MSKSSRTLIQEALDAASLDLKHWTSILPFEISSLDTSGGALVDSQIANLLEFVKPMYRGQKIYFPGKYNIESVCNGEGGSLFSKDAKSWRQLHQGAHICGFYIICGDFLRLYVDTTPFSSQSCE